jgi:hypothetical protein
MMKASARHRSRERVCVAAVKYALKTRNYVEAFRHLAWALEQATAADAAEVAERLETTSKARVRGKKT